MKNEALNIFVFQCCEASTKSGGKRLVLSKLAVIAKKIEGRENIAMGKMFARMVKFAKHFQSFLLSQFQCI